MVGARRTQLAVRMGKRIELFEPAAHGEHVLYLFRCVRRFPDVTQRCEDFFVLARSEQHAVDKLFHLVRRAFLTFLTL